MRRMDARIDRLLAGAAALGLQRQIELGPRYDAAAGPGLRLRDFAPWARGGLLLLSGGPAFFERFQTEARDEADPLDAFTRRRVEGLLEPLRREGITARAHFPFWNEPDPLPFQRIGAAAGIGSSLLGLDVDREFGTWLAYRALILLDRPVEEAPAPRFDPCAACAAPCIPACPAGAIDPAGWNAATCLDHRLDHDDPCGAGCHARQACPVGSGRRYPPDALRFHQAASLEAARLYRGTL
jgi:hypothetical protein